MNLFWNLLEDERGFILSAELVLVSSVLIVGLITGLVVLREAVVGELGEVAVALDSLDQSYGFRGVRATSAKCGVKSWTAGTIFTDADREGDIPIELSDFALVAPAPVVPAPVIPGPVVPAPGVPVPVMPGPGVPAPVPGGPAIIDCPPITDGPGAAAYPPVIDCPPDVDCPPVNENVRPLHPHPDKAPADDCPTKDCPTSEKETDGARKAKKSDGDHPQPSHQKNKKKTKKDRVDEARIAPPAAGETVLPTPRT